MSDPLTGSLAALLDGDAARIPLAVVAGAVTSVGPCVAPRYIALASLLDGASRRWRTIAAFVAGIILAYATIGAGGTILTTVAAHTSLVDCVLAVGLVLAGAFTLVRRPRRCRHTAEAVLSRPTGAFAMGAASALVISPCCTPIVAAVVAMNGFGREPVLGIAFLSAFALGHALPLLLLGTLGSWLVAPLTRWNETAAPATVSGALMIALGGYYGLLA